MECYYITWAAISFVASMVLEAINSGALVKYGEKKVKLARSICRVSIILSLLAVIIFSLITKNL